MENLKEVVQNSESYKEVLEKLGLNVNGTNYSKIKKLIFENFLSVEHFLSRSELLRKYVHPYEKVPIEVLLIENGNNSRSSLKKRIIREKILKYECANCHCDGNWMGKKISLILDHINGVNNDNRLENLRFMCPNCNATLDTHCGKNVKNKKPKKILSKEFYLNKNKHLRKTNRPDYEVLIKEIEELGYAGTGRKYGVSDNAIRKWINNYKKQI